MAFRNDEGRMSRGVAFAVRVAMGLGVAGFAFAAEPEQAGSTNAALEEVVVTAQFREQSVQTTPLAITAISAGLLESRSQVNISEITNQAPNVALKQQGAAFGPSLGASIRGIGQFDFNPALEPGVGLYVDDVYYATLTGSVLDLLDLERVEILRGPQGTLAGRNSIGGSVKLFSQKPRGDDSGSVQATYGIRNRIDLRATGDFAISDTLSARVSGVSRRQGGYIARIDYGCANPGNPYGIQPLRTAATAGCVVDKDSDVNYEAIRGALRWTPNDDLDINFAMDYTSDNRNPTGSVLVQANTAPLANIQTVFDANPANNAPLSAFVTPAGSYSNYASYYSPPGTYNGIVVQNYPLLETRTTPNQFFEGWGASLNVDWSLSDTLQLQSISAYREYESGFSNDNDLSPLASSLGFGILPFKSFSQEVRLNGEIGSDRLEYTLGAFYMDQRSRYESWQDLRYVPTNPLQFNQNDTVNADSQAVFGQLTFKATDRLTLIGGLRYTEETKDYTFVRITRQGTTHPFLGALNGVVGDYKGDNVDYRAVAQFAWTPAIMTYASFSTGFKGGGISPRPFVPQQARPFDIEKLDNYELGIKSDLFNRTLRLNANVFMSDYTDLQLGLQLCPQFGGPGPCGVIANVGDAEIRGLELEGVWSPVDGLAVDLSYSYLDFEYKFIDPNAGGPTRPTSIQLNMRPAYMPEHKAALGVQYEIPFGNGSITPRVDWSWQDDHFANANNRPSNLIKSYALTNARLTWRDGENKWETTFEATNLFDKYYFMTRFDQLAAVGHTDGQPGRPREWALTVKRKF
jgi:iron complex outermembrane recepter protein